MHDPFDRTTQPSRAIAAPEPEPSEARPSRATARGRRVLYALAASVVILAGAALWLPAFSQPSRGKRLTQIEAALTEGQYMQALTQLAEARADGLPDYRIRPLQQRAQAGPLLDAAQSHLAAGRFAQAQDVLDAAQEIAPNAVRGLGIQHQLLRRQGAL